MKKYSYIFLIVSILLFLGCTSNNNQETNNSRSDTDFVINNNKSENIRIEEDFIEKNKEIFKKWLIDTLKIIDISKVNYEREIKIYEDSLYFEIINNYDTIITKKYKGNDRHLIHVFDLLERKNELPKREFRLKLIFVDEYSFSQVEQLKFFHDHECRLFEVQIGNHFIEYHFIKGKFIDKKDSIIENP